MVFGGGDSFVSNLSSNIHCFLDGEKISKLMELVSLKEEAVVFVIGCYYGVSEGINILCDGKTKIDARFRLKIKVGDDLDEFEFNMHDDVVKKLAPLTCIELEKENGCYNMYPQELEKFLGDPILFKVRKISGCDSCGFISMQVLDLLIDSKLLELFLNPTHYLYAHNDILDHPIVSPIIYSAEVKSESNDTNIGQAIGFSGDLDSAVKHIGCSFKSNCSILDNFIGNFAIKRLSDLGNSKDNSTSIVIGWYDSVTEGVDVWYSGHDLCSEPRFRLKINVRDEILESTFVLFDEQVKKLAFETCGVLVSIGEGCCVYPDEMDVLYGDPMLFKVTKKVKEVSNGCELYEIVDLLNDPIILDKFFQHYMPSYGVGKFDGPKLSPVAVIDQFSSTECEQSSEDSPCVESKRKFHFLNEFSAQVDGDKSCKHPKIV